MRRLALRFLRRDLAASDFRLLLIALVIAVAAMTAVGLLADRVKRGLTGQANWLLAADAALISDHPIPRAYLPGNGQAGLLVAETATFPSMVRSGEQMRLAAIKAASSDYPLRGKLETSLGVVHAPQAGQAYIDRRIAEQWQLKAGDALKVGSKTLTVAAIIVREPDAVIDFSSLQPRVIINAVDLPATGLIGPGSRVNYRLLVAGAEADVARWKDGIHSRLQRGERLEDAQESRPEVKKSLAKAEQFLQLAGLLAALLAGVAILLAARRFVQRHYDSVALLRTLGASRRQMQQLLLGELLALVLLASIAGGLLGWLGQEALAYSLRYWLESSGNERLPAGTPWPWLWASAYALLLLAGTAGPQLLALTRTPPLRVLRRELQPGLRLGAQWLLAAGATLLLLWLAVRDVKLALLTGGGLLLAMLVSGAGGWLLIHLLLKLPFAHWRLALRPLARQPGLAMVQLGALTLGLTGLCLLTITRNDLLAGWQQRVPVNAPNHFAINIQPDQIAPLQQLFRAQGVSDPVFQPMIRGRWMAHNDQPVNPAGYDDDRAKRLAEREFNLSWGEALRADNRLIAGRMPAAGERGWTVEAGLAKTLNIRLGDTLVFDIAGSSVSAPVIALREVNWDSFRANFFVTGSQAMLADQPASMITSFYLPADQRPLLREIANSMPNVTVLDVGQLLAEVRRILLIATQALQLVLGFCLAAGLTVLAAALELNASERSREAALLRALGATQGRLRRLWLTEQSLLGAASGLTAGLLASGTGWALGRYALELPVGFNLWLPGVTLLAGALLATGVSQWRLQRLARSSPGELLRN